MTECFPIHQPAGFFLTPIKCFNMAPDGVLDFLLSLRWTILYFFLDICAEKKFKEKVSGLKGKHTSFSSFGQTRFQIFRLLYLLSNSQN